MNYIIEYVKQHHKFFVLIAALLILYYTIYLLVYGSPFSFKYFNIKHIFFKFFNIFDKKSKVDSNVVHRDVQKTDWKDALEELNSQASEIELDNKLSDLLDGHGVDIRKDDN